VLPEDDDALVLGSAAVVLAILSPKGLPKIYSVIIGPPSVLKETAQFRMADTRAAMLGTE
jgi:hypothetical protein